MYTAKILEKIENIREDGVRCWNSLRIGIFDADDKQLGEYVRNYSQLYQTFFPFQQGDKWYALYSKDYTATRVMELPSCKDVAGEERHSFGFCPVEYFVPYKDPYLKHEDPEMRGKFGFVAGCIWGDDCSWKIQHLDLSKISEGILKRDDRYGYIELPDGVKLAEAISCESWCNDRDLGGYEPGSGHHVKIACASTFNIHTGKSDH
jgi:hypothetical protein